MRGGSQFLWQKSGSRGQDSCVLACFVASVPWACVAWGPPVWLAACGQAKSGSSMRLQTGYEASTVRAIQDLGGAWQEEIYMQANP